MPYWKREPWDSAVLGVSVARVIDFSDIVTTEKECRDEGVDYLFGKAPLELLVTLQNQGFQVISTELGLAFDTEFDGVLPDRLSDMVVRSERSDEPYLSDLAGRNFTHDRFHTDPTIDPSIADESRRSWVRGAFRDDKLIWTAAGLLGFIIYHSGRIELICVDQHTRGHGLGKLLCAQVIKEHGRLCPWGSLKTTTQVSNIPARRMYLSAGFKPISSHLVVRKWLNG